MNGAVLNRPLLAALTGFKLVLHLSLANRYGYFRDELYFLDCGRHLAFGYVDHAPIIGLVARVALRARRLAAGAPRLPALGGRDAGRARHAHGVAAGGGRFAQARGGPGCHRRADLPRASTACCP